MFRRLACRHECFHSCRPRPPASPPFPYTTLFRSRSRDATKIAPPLPLANVRLDLALVLRHEASVRLQLLGRQTPGVLREPIERIGRNVRDRQVEVVAVLLFDNFQAIRALLLDELPLRFRCRVLKSL